MKVRGWLIYAIISIVSLLQNVYGEGYFKTHQQISHGQLVAGHSSFCAGITVGDVPSSKIFFNTTGLVNGPINSSFDVVNTATLVLLNDLRLGSKAVFTTPSNIQGNGYSLLMSGDMKLNNRLAVLGELVVNGQGNTLEIAPDGFFDLVCLDDTKSLVTTSTLRLRNMTLVINTQDGVRSSYLSGGKSMSFEAEVEAAQKMPSALACIGTLELENVEIILRNNFWFYGYLSCKGKVRVYGKGYRFGVAPYVPSPGVIQGSLFYVGPNVEFVYRGLGRSFFPCDKNAMLWFDGCQISVVGGTGEKSLIESNGWQLSAGNILFQNNIKIKNCARLDGDEPVTDETRSFELGNDGVAAEANLVVWPNAQLDVIGYVYHNPL